MIIKQTLFLTILLSFFCDLAAEAQVLRFRPGRLRFDTQLQYYNSKANFDFPGGSYTDLGTGKRYQLTRSHSNLIYDFSKNWSSAIGLTGGMAMSTDNVDTRTSSRLHRIEWRTRYLAYSKYFQLIPELNLSGSLFSISNDVDEVFVDDDLNRIEIGSWFQKSLWGFYNYLYLGYQSRNKDFSDLGQFKLGSFYRFNKYYFGLEFNGFNSMTDDKYVDARLNRTTITDRVNAGSLLHYAVNPSVLNAKAWAGLKASQNYMFKIGMEQAINGESYASGNTIWFQMEIRSLYQSALPPTHSEEQETLKKEFVPSTSGEDEKIEELFLGEEVEIQLEKNRRGTDDDLQFDD
ncbi:MAG: hypothetical protein R2827_11660 [Bdellovibrionales bacterium]